MRVSRTARGGRGHRSPGGVDPGAGRKIAKTNAMDSVEMMQSNSMGSVKFLQIGRVESDKFMQTDVMGSAEAMQTSAKEMR